jgi:hypothetical protein
MTPQELRDEIERLQKQLDSTPREFVVTVQFYTEASTESEIEHLMAHVHSTIREYGGCSVSYEFAET